MHCSSQMMDDHQQHLHRLRGKMAAEKETLRQQHIDELRRYKEDHGTEITRYYKIEIVVSAMVCVL